MSYPVLLAADDLGQRSDVVGEGTIAFAYDDIIPGVVPRQMGTHYLFGNDATTVSLNGLGARIGDAWKRVGFWAYKNDLRCQPGNRVRVHLLQHLNAEGYLTLMPFSCSDHSIVSAGSRESFHATAFSPADAASLRRINDLPARYAHLTNRFEANEMIRRFNEAPFLGWRDDVTPAFNIWLSAWAANPRVSFAKYVTPGEPPVAVDYHFNVQFVEHIPPQNPGQAEPLARTTPVGDDPVASPSSFHIIRFNRQHAWSAPGQVVAVNEYDFIHILAHEIGHSLGIQHLDDPNALMYPSFSPGPQSRRLHPLDIGAIQGIYGF